MNWTKSDGLIPAIVQDRQSGRVLMLGYMSETSLDATRKTGKVTFYSRSRRSLWEKGETSGHVLHVAEIVSDCDQDALLIHVDPVGPTCHRGTESCFGSEEFDFLSELEKIIQDRMSKPFSESYTSRLMSQGIDRVAQKVGEEAVETVIASKNEALEPLESEAADLLFHLMVLLKSKNSSLRKVVRELKRRHQRPTSP